MTTTISNTTLETYYLEKMNQILKKLKITIVVIMFLYSVYLYYRLKRCYNYYF
jgi:hypothetical protein